MSITSASRFTHVRIDRFAEGEISLNVKPTDEDDYVWWFGRGTSRSSEADLEALQAIWASDVGLQDGDDNALAVRFLGFQAHITEPSDLTEYGIVNPLDADAVAAFRELTLNKTRGVLAFGSQVSEDSTTGRKSISVGGDLGTAPRIPAGTTYDAPLDRWHYEVISGSVGNLVLEVDPARSVAFPNLTETLLRNLPGMRAMEALIRTWHSTLGDSATISHSMFHFRNLNLSWAVTDDLTLTLRVPGGVSTRSKDGKVSAVLIQVNRQSGTPAIDEVAVQDYLDTQTVETTVDGQDLEDTETGGASARLRGERLYLHGNSYLWRRDDGALVDAHIEDGKIHHTPLGLGETVSLDDIDSVTEGGQTYRYFPSRPHVRVVRLAAGSTITEAVGCRIPLPTDFVGALERDRPLRFHNEHDSKQLFVRGFDGAVIFKLRPHEWLELLIRQGVAGAGECISIRTPPERKILYGMANDSSVNLGSFARLDVSGGDFYVLPLPADDAGYSRLDNDYYQTNATAWTDGDDLEDIVSEAAFHKAGAWKILGKTEGILKVQVYLIARKSGASGSFSGPRIQVWRYRDGSVTKIMERTTQNVWVEDERVPLISNEEALVESGDIILPGLFRPPSSLTAANTQMRQVDVDITVQPRISLSYSP